MIGSTDIQRSDRTDAHGTAGSTTTPISVCHVVGSIGDGGRESLLEEIIRESPENISHVVCGLRVQDGHRNRFELIGGETIPFDATSMLDVRALVRLAGFLRRRSFDIVHAHGLTALIPCRLLAPLCGGSTVISTIHGVQDVYPDRLLRLERLTRRLDSQTVAVSHGVKHSFEGRGESNQWTTIQNGIDVESFNRAVSTADMSALLDRYPVSTEDFVFLNVGRYVPPKSQLDLVEAMQRVSAARADVHLFIVGGRGAMEGRLHDRVAEYGLSKQVTVTGQVDEIQPFYTLADAFVSSSTGEGLPIVLLEAMAAELPVIATDIPGVRELVDDGETGSMVPAESPGELGTVMLNMADGGACDRYGQAGYRRVSEEFNLEKTISQYVTLYDELTATEGAS